MPGALFAFACAFFWALSSALVKTQTHKTSVILINALRTIPAILLYWSIVIFTRQIPSLAELSTRSWLFLIGSTVVGLVIGDMFYFQSIKMIGLARALPISTTYPFFTILLSLIFFDESLSWAIVAGALLIVLGAYLLSVTRRSETSPEQETNQANLAGVAFALIAAVCWGASTVMVRQGLEGVSVPVANALRLTTMGVILFLILGIQGKLGQIKTLKRKNLAIIFGAGIIGTGLGTYAFLLAVQLAGAAKSSVLTATTPLFGVPLAILLKEKPSGRTLVGTVLAVAGVILTVSY